MKKFLKSWRGTLVFAVAAAGGTWLVAMSIADVRSEPRADFAASELWMDSRWSAVEAKLDLLIEAVDIMAGEDEWTRPTSST
ncbi:MAG: hypothetical protein OXU74_06685 [Gemmatimonadota bacterium]|nr:hypothetical protein [Gemmatimonadota bacterium]